MVRYAIGKEEVREEALAVESHRRAGRARGGMVVLGAESRG